MIPASIIFVYKHFCRGYLPCSLNNVQLISKELSLVIAQMLGWNFCHLATLLLPKQAEFGKFNVAR